MAAKDIFLFATMTKGCKKVNFMDIFNKISVFSEIFFKKNGVQNANFMGKSNIISLFAAISHNCKGKNILCNHDS